MANILVRHLILSASSQKVTRQEMFPVSLGLKCSSPFSWILGRRFELACIHWCKNWAPDPCCAPRLFRVLNWCSSEQPHPCCSQLPLPCAIRVDFVFGSRMVFNRLFSTKLIRFLTPDKLLGDFLHEMTVCNAQRSLTNLSALNHPPPPSGSLSPSNAWWCSLSCW